MESDHMFKIFKCYGNKNAHITIIFKLTMLKYSHTHTQTHTKY